MVTTTQTPTMKATPTISNRTDAALKAIREQADRLWDMNAHDSPEDVANEIREHLNDWLGGFDDTCRCRTPGILCLCPIRRYND